MQDDTFQQVVARVIARLAPRIGADGRSGCLIVVFSGATVAFQEAIRQVRGLVLDGFTLKLAFSRGAEQIFGKAVRDELAGFPHIDRVNPTRWLSDLVAARAVVSPLLSVNTISKVSLVIADNMVTNLILHALFMGKPVILARNGADPSGSGRKELGFGKGNAALAQAISDRMRTAAEFGCCLTDIERLREAVKTSLERGKRANFEQSEHVAGPNRRTLTARGRVVTAVDIRHAHRLGAEMRISSTSVITPLGRDLALRYGVPLVEDE